MPRINLLSFDNAAGLSHSARILARALSAAGATVTISSMDDSPAADTRSAPYDINIFMERIYPRWLDAAAMNCLVPNQEWFADEDRPYLARIDLALCKTRYAQGIFRDLGIATEYMSFTSEDRLRPELARDYSACFHLAGHSWQKGTASLVDLWQRHPDWPVLTVIQDPANALSVSAPNVAYLTQHVGDEQLAHYQNSLGVHLCPSEAEGFGHYIVEAMSCRAVTIATDAPPMNELVTPERGVLVSYARSKPQRLGTNFYVDPAALEQAVVRVMGMTVAEKERIGQDARAWYLENDVFFKRRVREILRLL